MTSTATTPTNATKAGIDPRSPQVTAGITAVTLVIILMLPTPAALVLTALQAALFATGLTRGVQRTPTAWLFRTFVRTRLKAPDHLEDPTPLRFAQGVGLAFTLVALIGFLSGVAVLGQVSIGLALVAALLNAVFAFCLGCEAYLLLKRITTA